MDKLTHNDELIEFPEDNEIEHINYLKEFREKIYPIYEPYMSLGDALITWKLNVVHNAICELINERRDNSY